MFTWSNFSRLYGTWTWFGISYNIILFICLFIWLDFFYNYGLSVWLFFFWDIVWCWQFTPKLDHRVMKTVGSCFVWLSLLTWKSEVLTCYCGVSFFESRASPAHVGCLSCRKWEGLLATCRWSWVSARFPPTILLAAIL